QCRGVPGPRLLAEDPAVTDAGRVGGAEAGLDPAALQLLRALLRSAGHHGATGTAAAAAPAAVGSRHRPAGRPPRWLVRCQPPWGVGRSGVPSRVLRGPCRGRDTA